MTWQDVSKIMDGELCDRSEAPLETRKLTQHTKDSLKCLRSRFTFTSEMDTLLRVATLVMQAVRDVEVTVHLQPSIKNHPLFTDIYFMLGEGRAFIEVKNPTIAVFFGKQVTRSGTGFEGSTQPPDQLKAASGKLPIYSNQRVRLVLWTSKPKRDQDRDQATFDYLPQG